MKKRKFLSIALAIVGLGTSFMVGSGVEIDPVLETAEEAAKKLFAMGLQTEELIVENPNEQEGSTYVYANYLQGLDGNEDYIIAQRDCGGYAIFEKESMELIEYSSLENSPYSEVVNENAYYAGPVNYYKKEDGKVKNIHTGKEVREEKLIEFAKKIRKDIKEKRMIRRNSKKERISLMNFDPGPTGIVGDPAYSYNVVSGSLRYIPNYQFFIWNKNHGENADGTCSSVATQLLLAYHNWASDGRLIPENDELEPSFQFFIGDRKGDTRAVPYDNVMTATTSTDSKNDAITTFYEVIKSYINPYARTPQEVKDKKKEDERNKGAELSVVRSGVESYLNNYTVKGIEVEMTLGSEIEKNLIVKIKEEIDIGRPVLTDIYWYYEDKETKNLTKDRHSIVVYGYQTVRFGDEDIDGLIAHFGWGEEKTNIWFNSDWIYEYMTFQVTHEHTYSTFIMEDGTPKGHINYCSVCGVTQPTNEHTFSGERKKLDEVHRQYNYYHLIECIECKYNSVEFHDCSDSIYKITNPTNEELNYHMGKCVCGYEKMLPHFYTKRINMGWHEEHLKECACGYQMPERHLYKGDSNICAYCYYENTAM